MHGGPGGAISTSLSKTSNMQSENAGKGMVRIMYKQVCRYRLKTPQ